MVDFFFIISCILFCVVLLIKESPSVFIYEMTSVKRSFSRRSFRLWQTPEKYKLRRICKVNSLSFWLPSSYGLVKYIRKSKYSNWLSDKRLSIFSPTSSGFSEVKVCKIFVIRVKMTPKGCLFWVLPVFYSLDLNF